MERIYSYDNNRNLTSITATNTPWYDQSFTYDALNRLTDATGRYGVIGYTYDKVGNRLTRAVNGQTETYTYFPGTNKLQEITGLNPATFSYDANGNITAMGTKTLVYNQNNRLIRVEENSTILGEYTYNGEGQRVIKTVDGSSTIFHYDLNGKLIAEGLPDGTITREYLYMGKIRMAMVDVASQSVYYYLNDRLGTPQLMTDDAGTIVWEGFPKPFGEMTVNSKSTVMNNFRFPGQYYDAETGLHYNYHRYYAPRTGRYMKPDPLTFSQIQLLKRSSSSGLFRLSPHPPSITQVQQFFAFGLLYQNSLTNPQQMDPYLYVQNNPVNWLDPEGLRNWGKLLSGFSLMVIGSAQVVGGVAIAVTGAAAAVAEVELVPVSFGASLLALVETIEAYYVGLAIAGAGVVELYVGWKLFLEGMRENEEEVLDYLNDPVFWGTGVTLAEGSSSCQ